MLAPYLARLSRRQRLVLVGMLLSSAAVITLAATLVVASPTTGGPATSGPHPTGAKLQPLTLTALPTPTVTTALPGTWGSAAPTFAQAFAFAPTSPATLMVCGVASGALQLARSPDGGKTWAAYRTGVTAQTCALRYSPTDAKSVALTVTQCTSPCSATAPAALYRSTDGGDHWAQASLPISGGFGGVIGWSGTTLYAATNLPAHPLAVSMGGAAFVLRDDIARFPGQIAEMTASGGALVAVLRVPAAGSIPAATTVAQSGNDGLVWAEVPFTDVPFTPTFVHLSQDGSVLAIEGQDTLVVSRTLGAIWQAAAPFPLGQTLTPTHFAARAPDGTLVALLQSTGATTTVGLFSLAPGTDTWHPLAAPPTGAQLITLSWAANGHPVAVWASATGHLVAVHF
ncbi:MAG: hypothetical protein H0X24_16805 [Ktedonobacterales bacterium]|nr:hypothetical protein [Ktedonobacterales bacterium]